jgi:hypothetical protein
MAGIRDLGMRDEKRREVTAETYSPGGAFTGNRKDSADIKVEIAHSVVCNQQHTYLFFTFSVQPVGPRMLTFD